MTKVKNIEFEAIEFDSPGEAVQYAQTTANGEAVLVDGKNLVVDQAVLDQLSVGGVDFAYLCEHNEQIVTIPVN